MPVVCGGVLNAIALAWSNTMDNGRSGPQSSPKNISMFLKKAVDSAPRSGNLSLPFTGDRINRFAFFLQQQSMARPKPSPVRAPQKNAASFLKS